MVKTSGKTILLSWGVKASGPSKVRPMARIQRCAVAGPLSMISKKWDGTCQGNHSMLVWEEGCLALIAWTLQLKGNINWHQAGQSSAERCFYLPTPVLYHVDWWLWPQMVHASSLFSLTTSNTRSIPANYSPSEYFFCSLFARLHFKCCTVEKYLRSFSLFATYLLFPVYHRLPNLVICIYDFLCGACATCGECLLWLANVTDISVDLCATWHTHSVCTRVCLVSWHERGHLLFFFYFLQVSGPCVVCSVTRAK